MLTGVIENKILLFGLIQYLFKDIAPFAIVPIHCRNKVTFMKDILDNLSIEDIISYNGALSNNCLIPQAGLSMIPEQTPLYYNKFCIEGYVNDNNEIVTMGTMHSAIIAIIFTLYSDKKVCNFNKTDKAIVPIYISSPHQPLKFSSNSNQVLYLHSLFLYFLSLFPGELPNLDILYNKGLMVSLSSLISFDFMVTVLVTIIVNRSSVTTVVEIFQYYLKCLQSMSGPSVAFNALTLTNIGFILTGKYDINVFEVEDIFAKLMHNKESIRMYLTKHMTPLTDVFIIDSIRGIFTVPQVYQDSWRELRLGIVHKEGNFIVLSREARLGQNKTTSCDFVFDKEVIKYIDKNRDKKLMSALVVEAHDHLLALIHLVTQLANEKYTKEILSEYHRSTLNDGTSDKMLQNLIMYDNGNILLKEIDIVSAHSELIRCSLDRMACTNEGLVRATYRKDNAVQYILYINNEFVTYPKDHIHISSSLNDYSALFLNHANACFPLVVEWVLSSINYLTDFEHIVQQLNSKLTLFISSISLFISNTECTFVIDILKFLREISRKNANENSLTIDNHTLSDIVNNMSEKSIHEYRHEDKVSDIFCLDADMGFLFYMAETNVTYFLDKETLLPFKSDLSSLNFLYTAHNRQGAIDDFQKHDKLLQRIYWQHTSFHNNQKFKSITNNPRHRLLLLQSFGFDTIKMIDFSREYIWQVLTVMVHENGNRTVFDIADDVMSNENCTKITFSHCAIFYINIAHNIPSLLIVDGNNQNIADLLLVYYMLSENMGFAFMSVHNPDICSLVFLSDNCQKCTSFF